MRVLCCVVLAVLHPQAPSALGEAFPEMMEVFCPHLVQLIEREMSDSTTASLWCTLVKEGSGDTKLDPLSSHNIRKQCQVCAEVLFLHWCCAGSVSPHMFALGAKLRHSWLCCIFGGRLESRHHSLPPLNICAGCCSLVVCRGRFFCSILRRQHRYLAFSVPFQIRQSWYVSNDVRVLQHICVLSSMRNAILQCSMDWRVCINLMLCWIVPAGKIFRR